MYGMYLRGCNGSQEKNGLKFVGDKSKEKGLPLAYFIIHKTFFASCSMFD
jgi:hypothetical protein